MSDSLRDIYKALESRYVHKGITIDPSFYNDLSDDSVAKFTAIGFNYLLSLDEQICPRFIFEFYRILKLERDSNNHFKIQFVISNHHFNLSLAQFTELNHLPNQGICIYSDAWGLNELEKTLKQIEPYNSRLHALDDIHKLIHRRTVHEKIDKEGNTIYKFPNQIKTRNRDHTQAVLALMLYCLENRQPFNLAYFIVRRMYFFRDRRDKVLPYGMILTLLFENLKENMAQGSFNERYKLVPGKMSSFKAKQPKRPPPKITRNVGKSKWTQLTTSSLTESPPSNKKDLPSTKLSPRSYHRALKDDPNMFKEKKETRGMFKNLGMTSSSKTNSQNFKRKTTRMSVKYPNYVNLTSSSEEQPNEKTLSPPLRKKSLLPPQDPSKSIFSKSTHYTSSSSPSESPTPTHVAPPPKVRFVILIKIEPQEHPPLQVSLNDPYVQTMGN
uniref:Pentatricopeptide repeat-containing protein n=1 Tax=Tanacetum cinerariifolium TaxID=118510 RepID=A0A6L2MML5_TANCI|nr:hypothetical protein [Tanacetum cinerariifolium]